MPDVEASLHTTRRPRVCLKLQATLLFSSSLVAKPSGTSRDSRVYYLPHCAKLLPTSRKFEHAHDVFFQLSLSITRRSETSVPLPLSQQSEACASAAALHVSCVKRGADLLPAFFVPPRVRELLLASPPATAAGALPPTCLRPRLFLRPDSLLSTLP